jgi:hypothetical protein
MSTLIPIYKTRASMPIHTKPSEIKRRRLNFIAVTLLLKICSCHNWASYDAVYIIVRRFITMMVSACTPRTQGK